MEFDAADYKEYPLLMKTVYRIWYDEQNRAYVIYPLDEMSGDLGVSKRKITDCLNELEEVDLIERVQRGNGLPNIIYVKKFIPDDGACLPGSGIVPFRVAR